MNPVTASQYLQSAHTSRARSTRRGTGIESKSECPIFSMLVVLLFLACTVLDALCWEGYLGVSCDRKITMQDVRLKTPISILQNQS